MRQIDSDDCIYLWIELFTFEIPESSQNEEKSFCDDIDNSASGYFAENKPSENRPDQMCTQKKQSADKHRIFVREKGIGVPEAFGEKRSEYYSCKNCI